MWSLFLPQLYRRMHGEEKGMSIVPKEHSTQGPSTIIADRQLGQNDRLRKETRRR